VEIERILARLWYLGECARACDLSYYYGQALEQRETLYTALHDATGSRHFWHVAHPGGARDDISMTSVGPALKSLESSLEFWRRATDPHGPLGRVGEKVGVISEQVATTPLLAGLAAAGSRAVEDLRQTRAYGGYADLSDEIAWPATPDSLKGDGADRMRAAVTDLTTSYGIALSCVSINEGDAPEYQARLGGPAASTRGEASVEGPHGPIIVAVTLGANSEIATLTLASSARTLVDALPVILEDTRLDRAPLLLASLDLCLECNDL
jgi:Ni,Fe-hydrogenase III large subunit